MFLNNIDKSPTHYAILTQVITPILSLENAPGYHVGPVAICWQHSANTKKTVFFSHFFQCSNSAILESQIPRW